MDEAELTKALEHDAARKQAEQPAVTYVPREAGGDASFELPLKTPYEVPNVKTVSYPAWRRQELIRVDIAAQILAQMCSRTSALEDVAMRRDARRALALADALLEEAAK